MMRWRRKTPFWRAGAAQDVDRGQLLGAGLQRDDRTAAGPGRVERVLRPWPLGGRRKVAFDVAHRRRAQRAARRAELVGELRLDRDRRQRLLAGLEPHRREARLVGRRIEAQLGAQLA
jgi:hypothetical protein